MRLSSRSRSIITEARSLSENSKITVFAKLIYISINKLLIMHLTQVKVQDLRKYKHTEAYQRLGLANISD